MIVEKYLTSDPEHIFMLRQLDKFMSGHNGFIAGGCFKNLFNHEKIKDIDVFFKTQDDFTAAWSSYRYTENDVCIEKITETISSSN